MDSTNAAFASSAGFDDGSCKLEVRGCTDTTALNFRHAAEHEDGSCVYVGCMDSNSPDFDERATLPAACSTQKQRVTAVFVAEGSVEDYTPAVRHSMALAIAGFAGVDPSDVSVEVEPASGGGCSPVWRCTNGGSASTSGASTSTR